MLQKSLKWMILTLCLAGLLIGGAVWLAGKLSTPAIAPQPSPTLSAAPTVAPTPAATPSPTPTSSPSPTPAPVTEADRLAAYIAGMSTEEKLGQLVMFGGSGTSSMSDEFFGHPPDLSRRQRRALRRQH